MQTSTRREHDPYDHLDAVLDGLHRHGPSLTGGLFNHAPMVAEALCAMDHGEHAPVWVARAAASFEPRPAGGMPVDAAAWRAALGDPTRFEDWAAYFRSAFASDGWQPTLRLWTARLAPGFTTAACHGVIRVGHAARALSRAQTPARAFELADALASWAAFYAELPVVALAPRGELRPAAALEALTQPAGHRPPSAGMITSALAQLHHHADFPGQVARIDLSGDPGGWLDELVVAFSGLFLTSVRDPYTVIVFTHAVTGAAAARNLQPLLDDATAWTLAFRAWEAGCALQAVFGAPRATGLPPTLAGHDRPARLAQAAVAHGDEHVIKLTEACLSTYRRRPENLLLAAAGRAFELA